MVDPCGQKNERKALALAAERARKTPAADTISAIVERYLAEYVHVPHMKRGVRVMMRPSSRKEIERLLRVELIPKLGDRRLEDSQDDIDNLLKTIAKRAPVIANRLLAWLRAICKWANKNHLIAVSPCEGIDPPGMESSRDRVLTDAEIRLFWLACEREGWPFGVLAKALLLTGQRRDEVGAMTWSEVNLTKAEWLLAGERVKNGRAHLLPLTAGMIRLLDGAPRIAGAAGYVFSTSGDKPVNGFSRAKVRIDAAMLAIARADDPAAEIPPWTFHDLRRTAASNLAALRTKPHVIESVLNHRSGAIKGVAAIYNRYDYFDEKREALEKWERRVERIAAGEAPSIAPREAPDVWEFGGGKTAAE
ncbi:MAG: site-specific integrase [Methylocystis sp.]